MSASVGVTRRRERLTFFRDSGWMLLSTGLAGVCNTLTHTPASRMSDRAEYVLWATLIDSLFLLAIPAGGLQYVFAHMTAGAVDDVKRGELREAIGRAARLVFGLWLVGMVVIGWFRDPIGESLRIHDPAALWLTAGVWLAGLSFPIFAGLLQGGQEFFWLGNASISTGAGRLIGVWILVAGLGGRAVGAMAGVLLGSCAALAVVVWASRDYWRVPHSKGEGSRPRKRVAAVDTPPEGGARSKGSWGFVRQWAFLTLGLAAGGVLLGSDTLLVQHVFDDDRKALYVAAGRVGRALVLLTVPLTVVLFPKVARSAATGESTAALKLALGATLGTGFLAALACTLLPAFPLWILYSGDPTFLAAKELVPIFCWSMLPLTAAYTLVNNLLARERFGALPFLVLVALGYAFRLWWIHDQLPGMPAIEAFRRVIHVLGLFSCLLLAVAVAFSLPWKRWVAKGAPPV